MRIKETVGLIVAGAGIAFAQDAPVTTDRVEVRVGSKDTPEEARAESKSSSRSSSSAQNRNNEQKRAWAFSDAGGFGAGFGGNTFDTFIPAGARATKPLVIPNQKSDPKSLQRLSDDLAVMARVLEKATSEFRQGGEEAAGIRLLMHGGRPNSAMYLDDYGAVFTVNVNMPLKPEPEADAAEKPKAKATSEDWEEAKNEVLGARRGYAVRRHAIVRRQYDPERRNELDEALFGALRNAVNIRDLKDSDWVTVVVQSGAESGSSEVTLESRPGQSETRVYAKKDAQLIIDGSEDRGSAIILRVRKSDLDEAARRGGGSGDKDFLKSKVSITQN